MMKNILNIDIYLCKPQAPTSLTKRIADLGYRIPLLHIFQKVQINSLIFNEGAM